MKFFINLGVKKKLIIVFSVVCIFMVLIGVEGILSSAKINNSAKKMYSNNLTSIKDLEEIEGNINEVRANMLSIVFERDRSKLDEQIKTIDDLSNEYEKWNKEYESIQNDPDSDISKEETKNYDDFKNELVKYREDVNIVIDLVKANKYYEAVKIYNSDKW